MTRRILLTLADDANDMYCGSCRQIEVPEGYCTAFGDGHGADGRRSPECIAAEAAAARLVDIDPADIAEYSWRTSDDHRPLDPWEEEAKARVEEAIRSHGRKT